MRPLSIASVVLALTLGSPDARADDTPTVSQWSLFEKTLTSARPHTNAQKYHEVTLEASFVDPRGRVVTVPGFWDGGSTWRIRFSPTMPGRWTYTIASSDADLDAPANDGEFTAVAPTAAQIDANPNARGFLKVSRDGRYLIYADDTPFLYLADTAWDGNSRNMPWMITFQKYVDDRAAKRFTALQILVGEPEVADPVPRHTGNSEAGPLFTRQFFEINPANFQNLDLRIRYVVDHGLVPVIFFNWGSAYNRMSVDQVKDYVRYIVARYQGYNVIWSVSGEYHKALDLDAVRAVGTYLDRIDGLGHLTTIHPGPVSRGVSSTADFLHVPWLDVHMEQTWSKDEAKTMAADYALADGPVINGEAGYDGLWNHDRDRVRREAWTVLLSGGAGYAYGAHGIWNWNPGGDYADALDTPTAISVINAPSAADMTRLADFFADTRWWADAPRNDLVSAGICRADPGREYIVYLPSGGETTVKDLPSPPLLSRWFNPATGKSVPAGDGPTFSAPDRADWVLHLYRRRPQRPREPDNPERVAPGLAVAYYEGDWNQLPDFDKLKPVWTGTANEFSIDSRKHDDYIGFRFTGYITIVDPGVYTFYATSDDGSRLWIGDTVVVDNDGLHGMNEVAGRIALKSGRHAIRLDFFEKNGGEGLDVKYEGPGFLKGPIPLKFLFHDAP